MEFMKCMSSRLSGGETALVGLEHIFFLARDYARFNTKVPVRLLGSFVEFLEAEDELAFPLCQNLGGVGSIVFKIPNGPT